ncbi:hypothetical protein GGS24DRAFT_362410 [Hypoxylon argillaceum]|nr:hypothetical protein GGS24DRAFT_362410 [Hypoxylon argillaceum]
MLASILLFSVSTFVAVVSASAIPQQQQQAGVAKRQTKVDTATIPTFSFGPSTTLYLGGGSATTGGANSSSSKQPVSGTATTTAARTTTAKATVTESPVESKVQSTAPGTSAATGTIPTFSYFPSSTVPVNPSPTTQPSAGAGESNSGGNNASNGTTDGTGDDTQVGSNEDLADLLRGLLDLLGA